MRNRAIPLGVNRVALDAAIRAGHGAEILRRLENAGALWEPRVGQVRLFASDLAANMDYAMDAQPEMVTQSNAGIPGYLTNWIDPRIIEVLLSPMAATKILGETKKGDWTTTVATFPVVEHNGETAAYGDYSAAGSVGVNANFPQRQSFHFQTWTQWGERELAMAGKAGIDWAAQTNASSLLILQKRLNETYFFGVAGLQNYGLLNEPQLYTPIVPAVGQWNLQSTQAKDVYEDIRRMFVQVQNQSNGVVDAMMAMTLALSPTVAVALLKTQTDGQTVNVRDLLTKNFPNLVVEVAVEYSTEAGELVQLIIDQVEGVETATCSFTEKMRAHSLESYSSYWRQKKSCGTFGTILFRPAHIAQLIGA